MGTVNMTMNNGKSLSSCTRKNKQTPFFCYKYKISTTSTTYYPYYLENITKTNWNDY